MRPSDEEIERQKNSIYDRQRKLYRFYRIKSFFGLATKGLNESNSLILNAILQSNKNDNLAFVIVNNIDKTDAEYIHEFHKKALSIDENDYVTIFFKVSENFGDFVIGKNIQKKLSSNCVIKLSEKFKKRVSEQNYIKATEELVKSLNRQLANA